MSGLQQLLLAQGQPSSDLNFEYTTLLLSGNGTNGAQNNTFLDSSTNNFTITRNGNTTQGTFSPFSQTEWGNFFDGTDDYLTTPNNAAVNFSNSNFTIEGWYYVNNNDQMGCVERRSQTFIAGDWGVYVINGGVDFFARDIILAGSNVLSSGSRTTNQWVHFAIVRNGSTFTLYMNGTSVSTYTSSNSFNDNSLGITIGRDNGTGSSAGRYFFNGYISNLRIVKGTAVYTSDFTVPTSPLTNITNTSLLTCQSNRFVDNSSNAFAITRNGDVSVQAFSPFNPTAAWTAGNNGGSGYFDGSGDYLIAPDNTALEMGSSNFTIECWFYPLSFPADASIISFGNANPNQSLIPFYFVGAAPRYYISSNGTAWDIVNGTTFGTSLTTGQWYHLALVRNGNTFTPYINGVAGNTATSSSAIYNSATNKSIGAVTDGTIPINGYLSGLRVVKGTAVYTANFTPPTAPLTAITNTSLLLNYTNAGIYDATSKNDLETVGNAQISTTQSKFGGSSMYFDGTGDYLLSQSNVNLRMGTGDFTIEAWVYVASAPGAGTRARVYSFQNHSASQVGLVLAVINTGGTLYGDAILRSSNGTGITVYTGTTAIPLNTWTHLALTRSGTTGRLFVNGNLEDTETSQSQDLSQALPAAVGAASNNTEPFTGYIQDLRVTKGVARYTAAFTPPAFAFPVK
jgi:hypothetical protein